MYVLSLFPSTKIDAREFGGLSRDCMWLENRSAVTRLCDARKCGKSWLRSSFYARRAAPVRRFVSSVRDG